jgi:hypothetical protein
MTSRPPPAEPLDLDRITEVVEHVRMTPLMLIGESFRILFVTDIPALMARIRALETENEGLREWPCGHRWTGSEQGIRCLYCGLVE